MYDGIIHIFAASGIAAQMGVAEFSTCYVQNCVITKNPEMMMKSKAAVFDSHSAQISNRPHDQIWILLLLENPTNTINISKWNNMINYTASYHLKSDIPAPYGLVKKRRLIANLEAKTEGVLWIVSNCYTNRREKIVSRLQRHIQVNIFGRCANGRISRKQQLQLMASYRFYLAFENNNCEEYVTEKFFEALRFGIVPVVYGARKEYYEQIAPPHSFIHMDDFERVEHLAAYILKLLD
ncbi:Glycoprotein 3-alpha-L-fucosyltransferase A [Aphelenchoides besseyi]|nr:Glycoprotein 3-alpha-L-fucosyltransferase A [Aphelenchoides besseyi]